MEDATTNGRTAGERFGPIVRREVGDGAVDPVAGAESIIERLTIELETLLAKMAESQTAQDEYEVLEGLLPEFTSMPFIEAFHKAQIEAADKRQLDARAVVDANLKDSETRMKFALLVRLLEESEPMLGWSG